MILSTEDFIKRAYCVHGDRYNYKLVDYKNIKSKRIYKNNINTYIKWAKEDNIMGKITDFLNEMRGGVRLLLQYPLINLLLPRSQANPSIRVLCPILLSRIITGSSVCHMLNL
jgi:hypothetical protein